ncbi:MAG: DMT family transporter [Pseudomonadota bacterium]
MRTTFRNRLFGKPLPKSGLYSISVGVRAIIAAWLAVIVYAASNPIVAQLVQIGETNLVEGGRNAITFGNLLVLGSLISLIPLSLLNHRDLTRKNVRRLTRRQWGLVAISAALSSALTPGLFFFALEHTSVTNLVLVGRVEPPLFVLATWVFLHEKLNGWAFAAGLIALFGALVILRLGNGAALHMGIGELATLAATLSYTVSSLVARLGLKEIPLGLFMVIRTMLGTALYLAFTSYFFGIDIYRDLFAPVLLKWVWVYVVIVVVIGQLLWTFALKHAHASDISMATSFSPVIAIMIAMVILGEDPGAGLLPGGAIMLISVFVGQCGQSLCAQLQQRMNVSAKALRTLSQSGLEAFDTKVMLQAR